MYTVAMTNQKGGVSKTTTTLALAAGLNNKGYKVLLVDADPQANASHTAGIDLLNMKKSLYGAFKGKNGVSEAVNRIRDGWDILTAGIEAAATDMEFAGRTGREYMMREVLESIGNYDFCVIDTPPTLAVLTMNALTAANAAIIPINSDLYSLQGIEQLNGFIENVRKYTNPEIKVSGLLMTKYNERLNVTQALEQAVNRAAESIGTTVFNTRIRESVAVRETQIARNDLFSEAPQAAATKDYQAFIDEFLTREGWNDGK